MAEYINLYQRAVYYDIALRRGVEQEINFIFDAYRHYTGNDPRHILDIACGPGYHAMEIVRRGCAAVALDLVPDMIALGRDIATAEGLPIEWVVADMKNFSLAQPVDAAICMFDGIDALLDNKDVIEHFRCVAAHLTDGGLYILQITHPRDSSWDDYGAYRYTGERDGIQVAIDWATNHPQFDLINGVARVESTMYVNDHGQEHVIQDSAFERLLLPQEITLLAEMSSALKVVGWYGDFNLAQSLDNSENSRWIIGVLQKQPSN